jgi:hypothetical protein
MLTALTDHPFIFAASAFAFALSVEAGATLLRRRADRRARIARRVADIARGG